jgi:holin-like protein
MIRSCAIIFGCLFIGELAVYFTGIPFPSSILGMLLLTVLLAAGAVKISWVKPVADLLIRNLAFFFVPAGVGLMIYLHVFRAEWFAIGVSTVISTFVVMAVVGLLYQKFKKRRN